MEYKSKTLVALLFAVGLAARLTAQTCSSTARFDTPMGAALDGAGNAYIADTNNNTIRKITPGGVVTTIAGQCGVAGCLDGVGTAAQFDQPTGIASDAAGNLIVTDSNNHTIRRISNTGAVTTIAGQCGVPGCADGAGGPAPVITGQPANGTFAQGGSCSPDFFPHYFKSVTATGTGLTYQWQKQNALGGWDSLPETPFNTPGYSGTTTNQLSINFPNCAQEGNYRVLVTNRCGVTVASSSASFTARVESGNKCCG